MSFAQLNSNEPLTREELISITAIVEYLAHTNGIHTENTYCRLAAQFNVSDVKQIKRRDYDCAVKYLVDNECQKVN